MVMQSWEGSGTRLGAGFPIGDRSRGAERKGERIMEREGEWRARRDLNPGPRDYEFPAPESLPQLDLAFTGGCPNAPTHRRPTKTYQDLAKRYLNGTYFYQVAVRTATDAYFLHAAI